MSLAIRSMATFAGLLISGLAYASPILTSTSEGFSRASSDGTPIGFNSSTVEVVNYSGIDIPGRPIFSDIIDRGIFEFDISSLASNTFQSVTLTLTGTNSFPDCGTDICPPPPDSVPIEVFAY